jgi:hypothetical protein
VQGRRVSCLELCYGLGRYRVKRDQNGQLLRSSCIAERMREHERTWICQGRLSQIDMPSSDVGCPEQLGLDPRKTTYRADTNLLEEAGKQTNVSSRSCMTLPWVSPSDRGERVSCP